MSKPLVSVLMPVYNAEKYLSEAIESILNQTYKNFEFIIIDDGSTDGSYAILKRYLDLDHRIKVIRRKKNRGFDGYVDNLNYGVSIAKGKYIARMDADDVSLKNRFKYQVDYLEKNPDISLLGSGRILIDSKGKVIGLRLGITGEDRISKILPKSGCIVHPSVMFRKDLSVKYRSKMRYCEDYDFFLNMLTCGKKMDNLFFPLIKYRFKAESLSRDNAYLQKVFSENCVKFFFQRLNYGKDQYTAFDPNLFIKNVDVNDSKLGAIQANFTASNYSVCKELSLEYLKKESAFNLLVWALLFLSKFKVFANLSKQLVHLLKLIVYYICY